MRNKKLSEEQREILGRKMWDSYIEKCISGMIDLRGGISRLNATGQLIAALQCKYNEMNKYIKS